MPTITIPKDEAKELIWGDDDRVIESSDWSHDQNSKYEYKDVIFKEGGKTYSLTVSRSGSPFTDWYYEWEDTDEFECYEVTQKKITTIIWEVVE